MIKENPLFKLIIWLLSGPQVLQGILVLLVVVSCYGVSLAAFETRHNYSQLQELQRDKDHLESEYEKLLLEQGAWAGYARLDEISRDELAMTIPEGEQVVVIRE